MLLNNLELEPHEVECAKKLVDQLERRALKWKRLRVLFIFAVIANVLMGLYLIGQGWKLLPQQTSPQQLGQVLQTSPDLPDEVRAFGRYHLLTLYIEDQIRFAVIGAIAILSGVLIIAGSVYIILQIRQHWNDGEKYLLLVKVFRKILEYERPDCGTTK